MTTTTIRVSEDLRDDLNLLKGIWGKDRAPTIDAVIRALLESKLYTEEFFERIREKVGE